MSKMKKVHLFLVEGQTDKTSLSIILAKILNSDTVEFEITCGDLFYKKGINSNNVITNINTIVKKFLNRKKYNKSDIIQINHLIDTDGAFLPPEKIKLGTNKQIIYNDNSIQTANVEFIQLRNKVKTEIVNKLLSTKDINSINYSLYFFSRNLEHVLHNDSATLSQDEKIAYSQKFQDKFHDNPSDFISFINSKDFAVDGTYRETWDYIKTDTHYLERKCNLHLFFKEKNDNT